MKSIFSLSGWFINKNPLFASFVILIVVDVVGTVLGQPSAYWRSGYTVIQEALPLHFLLRFHPLAFIFVCLLVWLPFTYWLVKKLRRPLNVWTTMFLILAHGYNSIGWLRTDLSRAGFFAGQDQMSTTLSLIPMVGYILITSWVATKSFTSYFTLQNSRNTRQK